MYSTYISTYISESTYAPRRRTNYIFNHTQRVPRLFRAARIRVQDMICEKITNRYVENKKRDVSSRPAPVACRVSLLFNPRNQFFFLFFFLRLKRKTIDVHSPSLEEYTVSITEYMCTCVCVCKCKCTYTDIYISG